MQTQAIRFMAIVFLGTIFFWLSFLLKLSALNLYTMLYFFVFLAFRPMRLISPISIIHGYYFVFFVVAPSFAAMHSEDDFSLFEYHQAFFMIFMTHSVASLGAILGENCAFIKANHFPVQEKPVQQLRSLKIKIAFMYLISTTFVIAVVLSSGGFSTWIAAPGDAFLNRSGSGIYVVFSHFFTFLLAALAGLYSYKSKSKIGVVLFIFWLAITSPVHGSKQLISTFLAVFLVPWMRNIRIFSVGALIFSASLLGIFFFGLYLRNVSWMTIEDALPYALNYFTALRNLMLLIKDFHPDFMETFFLPFNKFKTPFGLSDPSLYFDMNHMLTDKYFPMAWEIRATEQWPVEADLYLNFYFIFGLPLVFIYTFITGSFYGKARSGSNLGVWVVSTLLIFSIISHLRGSIYNHVDFYLYPMFFLIYLVLKKHSIPFRMNEKVKR